MPTVKRFLAGVVIGLMLAAPTLAVQPDEMLADPALEARAREISKELRCVVCQNQSIDDSNADLARDLRVLVRQRLASGDTDGQVIDYVVSRYGDFVLLRPPMRPDTYLLWFGPLLVLLLGGGAMVLFLWRRRAARDETPGGPVGLTAEEEERLSRLLQGGEPAKDNRI